MKKENIKYAELMLSMTTDYLMGTYPEKLYIEMVGLIAGNLKKLNEETVSEAEERSERN